MTEHEAIEEFKRLPRERQLRTLAILAHWVTVIGRSLYNGGDRPALVEADRVRALNEKLHWVCGSMVDLMWQPNEDASGCLFGIMSDDVWLRERCNEAVEYALAQDAEYQMLNEEPPTAEP